MISNSTPERLLIICYSLILSLFTVITFIIGDISNLAFGYILLLFLYLVPMIAVGFWDIDIKLATLVLSLTTLIAILVVIDPVEVGLYGHDPYKANLPSLELVVSNVPLSEFMDKTLNWPGFYYFSSFVQIVTGVPDHVVAKYIPLIVSAAPIFLFLAVNQLLDNRSAFFAASGFASTRTLLLFESKFVDETIAILLLTVLVYILARKNQERWKISLLVVFAIVSSHPGIAVFTISLLMIWAIIKSTPDIVLHKLNVNTSRSPSLWVGVLACLYLCVLAIYGATNLTKFILLDFILSQSGPGVPGVSGHSPGIRQLISQSSILVLGVLAGISAYGVLSRKSYDMWVYVFITYAGATSIVYATSLVAGQLAPIDPIRFLIVLILTLVPGAIAVLADGKGLTPLPDRRATMGFVVIGLLIVTQLAAIPPHVLYSDKSTTAIDEGHYTPAQFEASTWVSNYGSGNRIYVYEVGLWVSQGTNDVTTMSGSCTNSYEVWRVESKQPKQHLTNQIYSTDGLTIYLGCPINSSL